jgi:hypothetical protein
VSCQTAEGQALDKKLTAAAEAERKLKMGIRLPKKL